MNEARIIVLKTASDTVVDRLLDEIKNHRNIDCLIQPSNIERYKTKYPEINYINIQRERFEYLAEGILSEIEKKSYRILYIPHAGVQPYNFGNVILLASHINHKKIIFYSENGEKREIRKKGKMSSFLNRLMITYFKCLWRKGYSK